MLKIFCKRKYSLYKSDVAQLLYITLAEKFTSTHEGGGVRLLWGVRVCLGIPNIYTLQTDLISMPCPPSTSLLLFPLRPSHSPSLLFLFYPTFTDNTRPLFAFLLTVAASDIFIHTGSWEEREFSGSEGVN